MASGLQDSRRVSFGLAIALGLLAGAVGCRNQATRDDPFLGRQVVPPPPMGSYAPPVVQPGVNVQPGVLAPAPGLQGAASPTSSGAIAMPVGTILPASAKPSVTGGWTAADAPASSPAAEASDDRSANASEPRRLEVAADAKPLASAASGAGANASLPAQSASSVQFAQPASGTATANGALQWNAPAR